MAFKSVKQRNFYFAKKSGKTQQNPEQKPINAEQQVLPMSNPSNEGAMLQFKMPGLPKKAKFTRIKKNFSGF